MKIAVCISGILKSAFNLQKRNVSVLKEKFPGADFYYGTWQGIEEEKFYNIFPEEKCFVFSEPDIHYNPYTDIQDFSSQAWKKTVNWSRGKNDVWIRNSVKQILIHAMLLNQINKTYDVIIRTRFDAFLLNNPTVSFDSFVMETYKSKVTNGFAARDMNKFLELNELKNIDWEHRILDQLIIHPGESINYDSVMNLYHEKQLRAAEFGWGQVISEPEYNHKNWLGWINADRSVSNYL